MNRTALVFVGAARTLFEKRTYDHLDELTHDILKTYAKGDFLEEDLSDQEYIDADVYMLLFIACEYGWRSSQKQWQVAYPVDYV